MPHSVMGSISAWLPDHSGPSIDIVAPRSCVEGTTKSVPALAGGSLTTTLQLANIHD